MTKSSIKRLWMHLALRRKKQLMMLLVIMVVTAFAEVVSIGTVLPFLGVLLSPEKIFSSAYLQPLFTNLGITKPTQLLLPLTLLFIAAAIFSATMRLILVWSQTRLGHAIGADLSAFTYERTLFQPYFVHTSRNSSEVIAGISGKVDTVVYSVILPLLSAIGAVLILVTILATLFVIDPIVATVAIGGVGTLYALIMVFSRKQLTENSHRISRESNQAIKALQEGLGGIRDVLIDGTQSVYCKIYQTADLPLRRARADNQIIASSPRFLIEALGVVLIAILAFSLTSREGGVAAAIPILGALAISAQRLLPVLQQIYLSWSSLQGAGASLNDVLDLMNQPLPSHAQGLGSQPIHLNKSIKLKEIWFRYSDQTPWVLREVNLEIPRGMRVGFFGATGSGKSTFMDIVMALLLPSKGSLVIDDTVVTDGNFRAWQTQIAHVPQSIFLTDATIAENIAFGVPKENINYQLVERSAELAQIAMTIQSWEKKYQTYVGERGIRLSGGQRQRIGIARALYKQSSVLVFDEATSALDNETEASVMEVLDTLGKDITVLMIAHRLTTLKNCDLIVELNNGMIKSKGTYEQLLNRAAKLRSK